MGAGSREWPGRGSSCAFANNSPSHSIRAGQCGRISGCLVGHPFRSLGSALHWLVRNDRRVRARSGDAARRGDRVRGSVITMSDPTRPPVRIIHDQRGRCGRCAVESSRHVPHRSLVTRDDLARAREIARKHSPFVGGDMLLESVAKAIAQRIAEGRELASITSANERP